MSYRTQSKSLTQTAVTTHGLTKTYRDVAVVNNLNLTVPLHGVYGFLGPNGAGKSTTLKMILGLTHQSAGSITVLGRPFDSAHRVEILKHIGALIESPSYYPNLTARENLEIVRSLRCLEKAEIDEVLSIVKLDAPQTQKKKVAHFSLGMKQRLGIAKALLGKPSLIVLDEPTNGLDPEGIHEIRALIKSLPERYNTTVLVSSHILSEIDQMADNIGIIHHGNMKFQGSLESLHAQGKSWLEIRTGDNAAACQALATAGLVSSQAGDASTKNASDGLHFALHNASPDLPQSSSQPSFPFAYQTSTPGWLAIPDASDEVATRVYRTLAQNNIDLLRMEERKDTLEDIFLKITGSRYIGGE